MQSMTHIHCPLNELQIKYDRRDIAGRLRDP